MDELTEKQIEEQVGQLSPAQYRKLIRSKAMVSLLRNVVTDKKGTLSLKVMQGIGEFEAAKRAVIVNNFVSKVPAEWAARYVGSGSAVAEEDRLLSSGKETGDG